MLRFGCGGVGGVVARQRQAWRAGGGVARLAAMLALLARRAAVATRCRSIFKLNFVINVAVCLHMQRQMDAICFASVLQIAS